VQSGDHVRVERALNDAASELIEASRQDEGGAPVRLPASTPGSNYMMCVVVAVLVAVVVAIIAVVAPQPAVEWAKDSGLQHDTLVDLITERFAAPEPRTN